LLLSKPTKTRSRVRRVRVFSPLTQSPVTSQAKQKLTQMMNRVALQHGFEYNKLFIRNQKTKRGTCSSRRNLSLNIRLARAPDRVIEYVICHELTHLIHMNHARVFRDELAKIYPREQTKKAKEWLKINGARL